MTLWKSPFRLLPFGLTSFILPGVLLVIPLAWLYTTGLRVSFFKEARTLPNLDLSNRLVPVYLTSAILCALLSFIYSKEESHWIRNNPNPAVSMGGLSKFEHHATIQAKRELEALLNP
jgi:hypothetical protein